MALFIILRKVYSVASGGVSRRERIDTMSFPLNTSFPILVSEAGSVIVFKAGHPMKACCSISVSPSGKETVASLSQDLKQYSLIVLIPAGI